MLSFFFSNIINCFIKKKNQIVGNERVESNLQYTVSLRALTCEPDTSNNLCETKFNKKT